MLQILEHLRDKESRRGGFFTPMPTLWQAREKIPKDGGKDRDKFESTGSNPSRPDSSITDVQAAAPFLGA